ncbi:metallophosphoesterase [Myxococcus sp. CA006]|nr:metallophosphoesterase [Myxococcus sp. CA006]
MRIAVISDIHSNIEALTEVLRVAEHQKVDRFVSLGGHRRLRGVAQPVL